MAIKAVFFDMDGTLLTEEKEVAASSIHAINQLRQKGILVGFATGRNPKFILPYMAMLGFDVAVAYNGQYIFSRDRVLYAHPLKAQDIQEIITYSYLHQMELSLGTAQGIVGSKIMSIGHSRAAYRLIRWIPKSWTRVIRALLNHFLRRMMGTQQQTMESLSQQTIYQMMIVAGKDQTEQMAQTFPHLSFTRSSDYTADILSHGGSKLQGIKRVGKEFGYGIEEVLVFGDSENDLEMIQGAGLSVAMGNGKEEVKASASFVTDTNNRDGIYKALYHFGLVEEDPHVSK